MARADDDYLEEDMYFEHAGTECEVFWAKFIWGSYARCRARVPKGHPDFGVWLSDPNFPEVYGDVCDVTFTGEIDGDDWWIGSVASHDWLDGDEDGTISRAMETAKKLAEAVMERMP